MPFHYELPLPKLCDEPSPPGPVSLVRWLLEEGAHVVKGTPVVIVASEGTSYEVRANGEGTLRRHRVFEGQVLEEGSVLATIGADGEIFRMADRIRRVNASRLPQTVMA